MLNTATRPDDDEDDAPPNGTTQKIGMRRRGLNARGIWQRLADAQARAAEQKALEEEDDKKRRRALSLAHEETRNRYFNGEPNEAFREFCRDLDFSLRRNFAIPRLISGRNSDLLFALYEDMDIHKNILKNKTTHSTIAIRPDAIIFNQTSRANFSMDDAFEMALLAAHNKDMQGQEIELLGNVEQRAMLQHAINEVNAILHPDCKIIFEQGAPLPAAFAAQNSLNAYLKKMGVKGLPDPEVLSPSLRTQTPQHSPPPTAAPQPQVSPAPPPPRPQQTVATSDAQAETPAGVLPPLPSRPLRTPAPVPPEPPVDIFSQSRPAPAADTREPFVAPRPLAPLFEAKPAPPAQAPQRDADNETVRALLAEGIDIRDIHVAEGHFSTPFFEVLHDSVPTGKDNGTNNGNDTDIIESHRWRGDIPVFARSDERSVLGGADQDELELQTPLVAKEELQKKGEMEIKAIRQAIHEYITAEEETRLLGKHYGEIDIKTPISKWSFGKGLFETDTYGIFSVPVDLLKDGTPPATVEYFYSDRTNRTEILSVFPSSKEGCDPYINDHYQKAITRYEASSVTQAHGPDVLDGSKHLSQLRRDGSPTPQTFTVRDLFVKSPPAPPSVEPIEVEFFAVDADAVTPESGDAVAKSSGTNFKDRIKGLVDGARAGIGKFLGRGKENVSVAADAEDASTTSADGTTDDTAKNVFRTSSALIISGAIAWAAPGMNSSEAGSHLPSFSPRNDASTAAAPAPKAPMSPAELMRAYIGAGVEKLELPVLNAPEAMKASVVRKSDAVEVSSLHAELQIILPTLVEKFSACRKENAPIVVTSGNDGEEHKGHNLLTSKDPEEHAKDISDHYFDRAMDLRTNNMKISQTRCVFNALKHEYEAAGNIGVRWEDLGTINEHLHVYTPGPDQKATFVIEGQWKRSRPKTVDTHTAQAEPVLDGAPAPDTTTTAALGPENQPISLVPTEPAPAL